jgi:aromatic ring-opening dioxygenase catalytic subunit (LigB family)
MLIEEKRVTKLHGQSSKSIIQITHVMDDGTEKVETFTVKAAMIFGQMAEAKDERVFVSSAGSLGHMMEILKQMPGMLEVVMDTVEELVDDVVKEVKERKDKDVCSCGKHHGCH